MCNREQEHTFLMLFEGDHVGKPMHCVGEWRVFGR
jgi:hypothetical protein